MTACPCLPCTWRREGYRGPWSPCIYDKPYGLRRPGTPLTPGEVAQAARARAARL